MSLIFSFFVICFAFAIISEFGRRLAAKSSLEWWMILLFLLIAGIDPKLLRPLADFLGIQVISNLVLSGFTLFFLYQNINHATQILEQNRKFRNFVSSLAKNQFVITNEAC